MNTSNTIITDIDSKSLPLTTNSAELKEYTGRIKKASEERLARISRAFENVIDTTDDNFIMSTTGSDGRHENKPYDSDASNTEICIFHNTGKENIDSLSTRIRETMSFIIANVEIKHIGEDAVTLYKNDPNLIFPSRVWDSCRLFWNPKMDITIRKIISREIINNPHLVEKFYDRLRSHARINKTGMNHLKWGTHTQFDLEKNEFYYDPINHVEGMKLWPLRVIQYSLALALMRKIRNIGEHPDFINILPRNIPERLDFLLDNKLTTLSRAQVESLQFTYQFFLKMYHQMQYENFTSGTTAFTVDRDTLSDIKGMLSLLNDSFTNKLFI